MKTIGILTKPKFPDVKPILKDLVSWLREHQKDVVLDSKTAALIGESATHQKPQMAALADMLVIQPQAVKEAGVSPPVRLDLYLSRGEA